MPLKLPQGKLFRTLALVYGLVFFNVGAIVLYEKFTAPAVTFDSTFRLAVGCLIMGLLGLYAARRRQP